MARWLRLAMYLTSVMPKTLFSFPAGTRMQPSLFALPGAGLGYAVEAAVWKETLPSTFCVA